MASMREPMAPGCLMPTVGPIPLASYLPQRGGGGGLVAPSGFKPRAGGRKVAWVGSIPTRSRQTNAAGTGAHGPGALTTTHPVSRSHGAAPAERHGSMAQGRPAYATAFLIVAALTWVRHLPAQQPDTMVVVTGADLTPTQEREDPIELRGSVSPGGAFVRALLLPGWGHASIGSYTRGGFYFTTEVTTGIMLARIQRRLATAKNTRDLRESRVREELQTAGTSPDQVAGLVDQDHGVASARELVSSRRQQLEDWVALAAFLVLLSGADAFVSAHLRDFPPPVAVEAAIGPGGVLELGLSLSVGPPHRGG